MADGQPLDELLERGFRYALALTHDAAAAEDLLQDAWVALLKRGSPRHIGYLRRTLRNRFLDLERRRRLVALEPLDEASVDLSFLDQASSWPEVGTLRQGLGALRPQEREALYLAAIEGHTVREIAQLTGRPLGTVSSLVQRGRRKLEEFLGAGRAREES